ncbi:MAG: alpha/beta fold hydrolase [Planctomycetota bacterium]
MSALILARGTELFTVDPPLTLTGGGSFEGSVPFEDWGPRNAPLIVVAGGISADAHVASHRGNRAPGWWEGTVGPGCAIDTERYRVVALDFLGGPRVSLPNGTELTPEDQAALTARWLEVAGIDRAYAFIGASYGGAVGLQFARLHPSRLDRLITLAVAARPDAAAVGWRSLQQAVLNWGRELGGSDAVRAVELARSIGMLGYRGRRELERRFPAGVGLADYLDNRGRVFGQRFDLASYLTLSSVLDRASIDPTEVAVPTTAIGFTTDELVPLPGVRDLAHRLPQGRFVPIETDYGHDGFLKETEQVSRALHEALNESEVKR